MLTFRDAGSLGPWVLRSLGPITSLLLLVRTLIKLSITKKIEEALVPSGNGCSQTRELHEVRAARCLYHCRSQPEPRLVEPLGGPWFASATSVPLTSTRHLQSRLRPQRCGDRDLPGRASVRLRHLTDPAVDVRLHPSTPTAKEEDRQLRVLGVLRRARQRELGNAHRRSRRPAHPSLGRFELQRVLAVDADERKYL